MIPLIDFRELERRIWIFMIICWTLGIAFTGFLIWVAVKLLIHYGVI